MASKTAYLTEPERNVSVLGDYEIVVLGGGPAGIAAAIVAAINTDVVAAINSPAIRDKLATQLMQPIGNSPAEFRAAINAEIVRWSPVIKARDIRINWPRTAPARPPPPKGPPSCASSNETWQPFPLI